MQQDPPPQQVHQPTHKTRVPALNRKKSAVSLIKRKPTTNFMNLITSDDLFQRSEGIVLLAKKLAPFPVFSQTEIHLDVPNSPPVDGEQLKLLVIKLWEDHYPEPLFSWDSVTCIMFRLLTFEEYIPKLILEANADGKSENDLVKQQLAQMGLVRAKLFLQAQHPALVDTLFNSLIQYGGFAGSNNNTAIDRAITNKKDITRLPANRRKLTKQFLEWMDELVTPLIGLNEDVDVTSRPYEGVPAEYLDIVNNNNHSNNISVTSEWFDSDDNIRQCLAILLPLITTSTSGTMWHAPLVTFIKHMRLLNQRLFEMVTTTYDEYSVNKICRVLGIHIRVEAPLSVVPQQHISEPIEQQVELKEIEPEQVESEQVESEQVEQPVEQDESIMAVDDIIQHEEPVIDLTETIPIPMQLSEPPVAVDEVLFQDPPSPPPSSAHVPIHTSYSNNTSQPIIDAPLVDKLTIQERNDILDHDVPLLPLPPVTTSRSINTTHFDKKEEDQIPIPDYYNAKQTHQNVDVLV